MALKVDCRNVWKEHKLWRYSSCVSFVLGWWANRNDYGIFNARDNICTIRIWPYKRSTIFHLKLYSVKNFKHVEKTNQNIMLNNLFFFFLFIPTTRSFMVKKGIIIIFPYLNISSFRCNYFLLFVSFMIISLIFRTRQLYFSFTFFTLLEYIYIYIFYEILFVKE